MTGLSQNVSPKHPLAALAPRCPETHCRGGETEARCPRATQVSREQQMGLTQVWVPLPAPRRHGGSPSVTKGQAELPGKCKKALLPDLSRLIRKNI